MAEQEWSALKMIAETCEGGARPWGSACGCVPWARTLDLPHEGGRHRCCLSCGIQWVEWGPPPSATSDTTSQQD